MRHIMTETERRLCLSGLLLFFLGLPLGFVVHSLPNQRVALSAHLNAVQSGTALMVLGLLWPRINLSPRLAAVTATGLSLAFWGLELRILAAAFALPAGGVLMKSATVVGALCALAMVLTVGTVVFALRAAPPERAGSPANASVESRLAAALNQHANG
jgi:(hydroxyamino)benzene mutase